MMKRRLHIGNQEKEQSHQKKDKEKLQEEKNNTTFVEVAFVGIFISTIALPIRYSYILIVGKIHNGPPLTNFNLDEFIHSIYQSPDHIVISDPHGVVIYVNKAAERVTGFSVDEILGTKAGKLWGGLMDEEYYKMMWKIIMLDKQDFIGLIKNKRKDGVLYSAIIRIIPITDEHDLVRYFIGIEKPVTGDGSDLDSPALQSINVGQRKASDIEKVISIVS